MAKVGLHLRIKSTMKELIERALRLELPFFQSFLIHQKSKAYITCTKELITLCSLQGDCFDRRYVHGSYFINLASSYRQRILKKEIELAKRLSFTHVVFHPGAMTDVVEREIGIDRIAKTLDTILKRENDLIIVLENSAHAQKSLGGSLEELALIRSKLEHPEKVQFCLDTAHAYVFGYNIQDDESRHKFIEQAATLLGKESLALIHLNDTQESLGSRIDRHCIVGQGCLGKDVLKKFITHPLLKDVPIILELPELSEEKESKLLKEVQLWCKES